MRRSVGPGLLASLVVTGSLMFFPSSATAFGTIDGGGQHREHERITRAAVACSPGADANGDCFEPRSADQLAGQGKKFGAVGSPDLTEVSDPAAHCDDADYLAGDYPRARDDATAMLLECVSHLRGRFREAIDSAKDLLDDNGRIAAPEVNLDTDCELTANAEHRAKCKVLEGFGRALHGAQDFYSHSNWVDRADQSRSIGADNPPGLSLPAPSPVLDLSGSSAPTVPPDLTTGCFVPRDRVPGVEMCAGRTTHAALNKDNGVIDASSGNATDPTTMRGMVSDNFAKAVAGAEVETRHQWQDFRAALERDYGVPKAALMTCALTRDDPSSDCAAQTHRTVIVVVVSGTFIGLLGAGLLMFQRHRRRRGDGLPGH
jgi:hypothetical protein